MSNAFNLSQLANFVNSSGQVALGTGVTGTLPVANGGTNNGSLAVTAGGTLYTDGSKIVNVGAGTSGQVLTSNGAGAPTWATPSGGGVTSLNGQTGSVTSTDLYAIGSFILARSQPNLVSGFSTSTIAVNTTIAGTSLLNMSNGVLWNYSSEGGGFNSLCLGGLATTNNGNLTVAVTTGSWRCVSPCGYVQINSGGNISGGLWVRYA